jgi:ElaA protein
MITQSTAKTIRHDRLIQLAWNWYRFDALSVDELYAILALRQKVFVVEQQCPYLDCDGIDGEAHHLVGWQTTPSGCRPMAYLRVIMPEEEGAPVRIGRLLTHPKIRGQGVGRELLRLALVWIEATLPKQAVAISAQHYLRHFYQAYGFVPVSDVYMEDGIAHLAMIRHP